MNLTKKQQIQVSLIVVCVVILFWQLYQAFRSPADAVPPVPAKDAKGTANIAYPATNLLSDAGHPSQMPASKPAADTAAATLPALEGPGAEYTRLSSELQLIQMQRAIAESYEAIAVAKRNTAKAMAETAQIMGGSVTMPGGTGMEPPRISNDYELIYTGQEGGQWTATLKKNNQTFDVVPNTVLGNMKVVRIDDNGVTVVQGNERKVITFNGIIPEKAAANDVQASAGSAALVAKLPVQPEIELDKASAKAPAAAAKPAAPAASAIPARPVKPVPAATPLQVHKEEAKVVSTVNGNSGETAKVQPVTVKPAAAPVIQAGPALPQHATSQAQPLKPVADNHQPSAKAKTDGVKISAVSKATQQGISALKPAHYTIQLIADTKQAPLKRFINVHRLHDQAQIVKVKKQGEDWYIVIYGDYPSVAAANKALENLDSELKNWEPYVRKIGSIQAIAK